MILDGLALGAILFTAGMTVMNMAVLAYVYSEVRAMKNSTHSVQFVDPLKEEFTKIKEDEVKDFDMENI